MSLPRTSTPPEQEDWASPGLTSTFVDEVGRFSSGEDLEVSIGNDTTVVWESARKKPRGISGWRRAPFAKGRSFGFFQRYFRKLASRLPRINVGGDRYSYAEKEKLGRGRWHINNAASFGRLFNTIFRTLLNMKLRFIIVLLFIFAFIMLSSSLRSWWRRAPMLGGGKKFVIMLAANMGGGVMEWKGPREWAIERDSIRNKRKYAARWGYDLEIVDMSTKKRYAHEWRESWEKADAVRSCMQKYPQAEWFWWLDLNTFIMEPSYSLQTHIFNDLSKNTYRDINHYNPLNIAHPLTSPHLDDVSLSATGDNNTSSINLIVPQDCSGFNLGSFFIRRSSWTDQLLDIWWDPVLYEQKHMDWEHKEQDALEALYTSAAWIRPHTAFIEQRKINSFPDGACSEKGVDPGIHYKEEDRDFVVNMAGCQWGRDCWGEMYHFRELSNFLNRTWWERFKEDVVAVAWFKITGQKIRI